MYEFFSDAVATQFQPEFLVLLLVGCTIGLISGAIPGFGLPALTLALAFSFWMKPISAVYLLCAIQGASAFGGSVSAILLNVPGEAVNAASTFDGYPMSRRGEATRALSISATSSALGAFFSILFMLSVLGVIRRLVFAIGPPEFFMLILCGLVSVIVATRANMIKGLAAAGIGILLSLIGFSSVTGVTRFTFGTWHLWDGIGLITFFVGLFAFSEIMHWALMEGSIAPPEKLKLGLAQVKQGVSDVFRHPVTFLRSSLLGVSIGLIPGVGASVSNFLAYTVSLQSSRTPELYGTGHVPGLIASESSNNATIGGSLVPTMAFGIPGSVTMAVLMGAFMIHGLAVGPLFMREHMDIVWMMIMAIVSSNIIASGCGLLLSSVLSRITTVRVHYLIPVVLIVASIGVFTLNNNIWDVVIALVVGVFGYLLKRFGFPIVSLVIGFILGVLAERAFLQSMQMSLGDPSIFFERPISLVLFLVLIVLLVVPLARKYLPKRGAR